MLLLAWLLAGWFTAPQPPAVQFHHVHYRVEDPSTALTQVASTLGGTRVLVPGLGVGVEVRSGYLLFDRLDADAEARRPQPPIDEAYRTTVAWLEQAGIRAEPGEAPAVVRALPRERYDHIAFVATQLDAVTAAADRAGAKAVRRTEQGVLFEIAGGLRFEIVRDATRPDAFWCPMHPDVRSPDAGACHLCGMDLVPIPPPKVGEYKLDVDQLRSGGRAGLAGLRLTVREPDSGATVSRFVTVHDRPFHLFIVGRDLEHFEHVHPQVSADGSLLLTHDLPPGEYMLFADFLPAGGTTQMVQRALIVPGTPQPRSAAQGPEDVRVSMEAKDFEAGKYACLTFSVRDARTGAPVTDLEPYLGAPAHLLLVRSDLGDAVHVHPEEIATSGPDISFHPLIPAAGDYKLWVQVQRRGRVITVPFPLRAAR